MAHSKVFKIGFNLQLRIIWAVVLLASCSQPDRQVKSKVKVIDGNRFAGFCLKDGIYLENTLLFTRWDSLNKTVCPGLIIKKDHKLASCLPDIFKNSGMGISGNSNWSFYPETGKLILDITDAVIDNQIKFKAGFQIIKFNPDTLILKRTELYSKE